MVSFLRKYYLIYKPSLPREIQLQFLKRLLSLLSNGYPLIEALEITKWDKQLIKPAHIIILSLKRGLSIDQAFETAKFDQTIVAYLYFVHETGDIQSYLEKCIDMFEKRLKHFKKLQQVSRYPLILITIFLLLLFVIKKSVLPSFTSLSASENTPSFPLKTSLFLFNNLGTMIGIFSLFCLFCILLWKISKRKLHVKTQIKYFKKIPIYRRIITLQTSFQFSTHLSALLKTNMPLKGILNSMAKQEKIPIIAYYASLMVHELNKGHYVTDLLSELDFIEKQLAFIFQKNKDTLALGKDLSVYAELLVEELQRNIIKIIAFIQPVFFVVLACLIIFVYLALMMPMYELIKTI